jgi:hypothetical protein
MGPYHFKIFISSIFSVGLFLNNAIIIAKPTAASAAATAMTKKTNNCPTGFPLNDENVTKLKLAELSISSIDIKTIIALRRVSTPATPTTNMTALRIRKYSIGIVKARLPLSPPVANAPLGGRPKGRVLGQFYIFYFSSNSFS